MEDYLNPNDFYAEHLESWRDIWNEDLGLYANLESIVNSAVFLPDKDIQTKIAISYLMTSQKWAKVLPLLLCYGREGTGKSTLTKLASKLRGAEILGQSSTFASIRNELNASRWMDDECEFERDGASLLFDNVYASTFTANPNLLALILSGYDKASDKLMIASSMGENIVFRTFSTKIISSVEPIWLDAKLKELSRRLLVIRHKRLEELEGDYDIDNHLDLSSINWDGLDSLYRDFWNNRTIVETYVLTRKMLTKRGKKGFTMPESLSSNQWTISIDIIATGIALGAWNSIQDAVNHVAEFFEIQTEKLATSETAMLTFLRGFVEREVAKIDEHNKKASIAGVPAMPMIIRPGYLTEFLKDKESQSLLDQPVNNNTENSNMFLLGWKKSDRGWEPI